MLSKQVTDFRQSERMCSMGLIKTADMHYHLDENCCYNIMLGGDLKAHVDIPAWSAPRLLCLLPKQIELPPLDCDDEERDRCAALELMFTSEDSVAYGYRYGFVSNDDEDKGWLYINECDNMVNALYDLVCFCYNENIKLNLEESEWF